MINLYNEDCLQAMKRMETDQYDLAIVDPPYGIKVSSQDNRNRGKVGSHYKIKDWDNKIPPKEYFIELMRVSKNQVIWGGNYFIEHLYNTSCMLVWDKRVKGNIADCELAWTSFNTAVRKFEFMWEGYWQENMKKKEKRIHPTQKPVQLYKWILSRYAKEGFKILDTHLGSGSIAVACHDLEYDLDGYELDTDYYENATKRLKEHQRQLKLF